MIYLIKIISENRSAKSFILSFLAISDNHSWGIPSTQKYIFARLTSTSNGFSIDHSNLLGFHILQSISLSLLD